MTLITTTPATTHSHGTARRGLGGENCMGRHLARVNSPADKYEGCYLARKGMAWLVCATTWMLAALLVAFLAGGGAHKAVGNIAHAIEASRPH